MEDSWKLLNLDDKTISVPYKSERGAFRLETRDRRHVQGNPANPVINPWKI